MTKQKDERGNEIFAQLRQSKVDIRPPKKAENHPAEKISVELGPQTDWFLWLIDSASAYFYFRRWVRRNHTQPSAADKDREKCAKNQEKLLVDREAYARKEMKCLRV